MLKGEPFFAMARPSFFVEFLFQPFRITGRCLTFFPICRRSSAKTISGVRSKNPMPFFQLIPQWQCCKLMNCCFIFRPQFGQTLLLAPIASPCTSVKRVQQQAEFSISVAMPLHNLFPQWLYLSIHLYFTDSFEEQKTYIHLVLYEYKFDR